MRLVRHLEGEILFSGPGHGLSRQELVVVLEQSRSLPLLLRIILQYFDANWERRVVGHIELADSESCTQTRSMESSAERCCFIRVQMGCDFVFFEKLSQHRLDLWNTCCCTKDLYCINLVHCKAGILQSRFDGCYGLLKVLHTQRLQLLSLQL
mmetsp:Transcript_19554/g.32065  ORF Transcript_19554/g.32065 Transcript_19554/m.32065 type:complete len:153 (+) Transcript_19554:2384-2842(+)